MIAATHDRQDSDSPKARRRLAVGFVVLTLLGVGVTSRYALLSVVFDGLAAAIIVVPAMLMGFWLVPLFRAGSMPLRWHLLLGAALGLGLTSLLVLLLGLVGLLQRPVWITILFVFAASGIVRIRTLLNGTDYDEHARSRVAEPYDTGAWSYLWLLACPFLVLGLLAASNAPGFIWQEEGFGYDVLEYHLLLPKEYYQAGRITYLPHNVYANFPANVEMLYLLAMVVLNDVHDVGTVANMIHLIFGVLTVFAAWVAGREWSPQAGIISAVVVAMAGWLAFLCGLAYVENGMLFFGMVAAASLLRATRFGILGQGGSTESDPADRDRRLSWISLAGAVAGFACGCKYTALPMIAAPLGLGVFLLPDSSIGRRVAGTCVFTLATLLTFSPWLIKNQVMTGNPVFPVTNRVFEATPPGWGAEETELWVRGHSTQSHQRAISARLETLWNHVLWDKYHRFGPAIILLAAAGFFGRQRDRVDLVLLVVAITQLAVWLSATHLFARFAVVLLIPLSLLCGRGLLGVGRVARKRIIAAVLLAGSGWNFTFAALLHKHESPGGAPASLIYQGEIPAYEYFGVVNHELPLDARILMVGDSRAFYFKRQVDYCVAFNRNPFFEAVRTSATAQELLNWLSDQGYTHVLVNWSEIGRLASTYGFSPAVSPRQLEQTFDRLSTAGLRQLRGFLHPQKRTRYVELYEIPR